jgi:hypothetical protein
MKREDEERGRRERMKDEERQWRMKRDNGG